jgi:hypothetical protein
MKKISALLGLSALIFTGCQKDDVPDYTLQTVTFEDVPTASLAGPTAYGDNLYPGFSGGFINRYTDPATGLKFSLPYDEEDAGYPGGGGFGMGGAAISRWNDTTTAGYSNQCSAYYSDPATGKGGRNGSQTFSVVYYSASTGANFPTFIEFENSAENVIDHFYISNSTYAALSMKNGDAYAKKFTYEDKDWFKLIITGANAAGTVVGKVECYLSDFRTASSGGILEGWHKVDLAPLGNVNRLTFHFESSDVGEWGMNTPAYVCIDDITVRQ